MDDKTWKVSWQKGHIPWTLLISSVAHEAKASFLAWFLHLQVKPKLHVRLHFFICKWSQSQSFISGFISSFANEAKYRPSFISGSMSSFAHEAKASFAASFLHFRIHFFISKWSQSFNFSSLHFFLFFLSLCISLNWGKCSRQLSS